jgi:hypothetical protein
MTSIAQRNEGRRIQQVAYPASSISFDLTYTLLSILFAIGLFLDGWAHNHGRVDDTFFTTWHAILYGSYALIGLLLMGTQLYNMTRGYALMKALPRGYWLALIGVLIFAFAGGADMFWHETFGFEEDMEALLSPSHLSLAIGAFLFLTGTIRSAWQTLGRETSWRELFPSIISWTVLLSLFTFFTQPFGLTSDMFLLTGLRGTETEFLDIRGVGGILISASLMVGVLLMMMRRWKLPLGTVTVLFTLNGALMTWLQIQNNEEYGMILAFLISGLIADALLVWLNPSPNRVLQWRTFAALTPFILSLVFMAALQIVALIQGGQGLWWEIHMWLGAPMMASIAGLFLSYLAVPPQIPEVEAA